MKRGDMVTVEGLKFGYRRKKVFSSLDFKLPAGCVCGLLGENGAGKTTLLNLLAGLLFPEAGSCKIGGFVPSARDVGFLSRTYMVGDEVPSICATGSGYVKDYAPFYRKFGHESMACAMKEFKLDPSERLDRMSYGSKKKFFLAFALATNAEILLFDEPTNGLDINSKGVFRKLLTECVDAGRVIVISTHQVRELENIIDPVMIIADGEVLLNQSLDSIRERLSFAITPEAPADALHCERTPEGWVSVMDGAHDGGSCRPVDVQLELLFSAVLKNPSRIKSSFAKGA